MQFPTMNRTGKYKKGTTMMDLVVGVIALVILAVALVVGAKILSGVRDTQTTGTLDANLTDDALGALGQFGPWLPIIVLILIAGFVIGYLITRFTRGAVNPS